MRSFPESGAQGPIYRFILHIRRLRAPWPRLAWAPHQQRAGASRSADTEQGGKRGARARVAATCNGIDPVAGALVATVAAPGARQPVERGLVARAVRVSRQNSCMGHGGGGSGPALSVVRCRLWLRDRALLHRRTRTRLVGGGRTCRAVRHRRRLAASADRCLCGRAGRLRYRFGLCSRDIQNLAHPASGSALFHSERDRHRLCRAA
jgi:hypothetical protein